MVGVLVVQMHPVFLNCTTLLPNCSLHGINTFAALEFCALLPGNDKSLKTALFYFVKPKLKSLEGKNVYRKNKRI